MKKKILTGAVTLFSVVALAACSQTAKDKDIVTMKGETITVSEFYDQVKNNGSSQQVLLQMAIKQVFEEKYGKKVTDKEVEEAFEKIESIFIDQYFEEDDEKVAEQLQKAASGLMMMEFLL